MDATPARTATERTAVARSPPTGVSSPVFTDDFTVDPLVLVLGGVGFFVAVGVLVGLGVITFSPFVWVVTS